MRGHKPNEIEHGICLPFKCTSCESSGISLKETSAQRGMFHKLAIALSVKKSCLWYFQCNNCGLVNDIPEEEEDLIIELHKKALSFQNNKIHENEFIQAIDQCQSKLVKELKSRSISWICTSCKNEVPATFEVCWNCGEECHDPEKLIQAEGELNLNTSSVFGSSYSFNKKE